MDVPVPVRPSNNSKYLERHQYKPWAIVKIKRNHKEIGYIQLVDYFRKGSIPHLEYYLDKDFRKQGIMSKELPKYLKDNARYGLNRMVAITDIDNIASQKLLEKNGFVFVTDIANKKSYVVDLRYTKKDIEFATNVMAWHQEQKRLFDERYKTGN